MGGMCSGETIASLERVAVPNGMVMISPSATSPALTDIDDQGYFFRTSPSDARQGEVMSDIMNERGVKNAAVTYTNNDYGKGLAESFKRFYEEAGGTVTIMAAHDDGKADYSAEVAALAAAGGDALAVVGYGFDKLKLHRLEAACLPTNHGSRRVLEKSGFKYEGVAQSYLQINGRWRNHVLYANLRGDRRGRSDAR